MANTYHIHPRYDGTWLAIKEGALSVSVRASTLAEAVERTCEAAQRWNADVLLHRADGSVERLCEGPRHTDGRSRK